ncbi:MAG: response regulator [Dehalococcoidales bacterium]|nr:response regulator [Dehalococcoidales bacterium]
MAENRGTILIVDDEESIRDILCRKLQSQGYYCVVAVDGNDALWKAFMQDFDLVIMDIKMPGMSGMEVLPKMVTDHPDICVIMLTAVSDIQTAVEAMKVGAYDYLTKPFNLDDLIMRVERALERRRLVLENRDYQYRLETKVQQQAGQLRQYHSDAEEVISQEQAALAEIEAARQPSSEEYTAAAQDDAVPSKPAGKITRKLSQLLGGRTSNLSFDENNAKYIQVGETHQEGQAKEDI